MQNDQQAWLQRIFALADLRRNWRMLLSIVAVASVLTLGWVLEPEPTNYAPTVTPEVRAAVSGDDPGPAVTCIGECWIELPADAATQPANQVSPAGGSDLGVMGAEAAVADLDAQRRMAHWAAVTALLTGLGVFFVILTLRAALDANQGFREGSERQLRAYVAPTVTSINVTADMKKNFPQDIIVRFSVVAKNHGQTPAYDARVWADIAYLPLPVPAELWRTKKETLSQNSVIPPDGTATFSFEKALLFDEKLLWATPPNSIILTGVIRYRDAFNQPRFSRFTGHLKNLKKWWHAARNDEILSIEMEHSETGNEAE